MIFKSKVTRLGGVTFSEGSLRTGEGIWAKDNRSTGWGPRKAALWVRSGCLVSLPLRPTQHQPQINSQLPSGPLDSPQSSRVAGLSSASCQGYRDESGKLCLQEAEHQVNTTADVTLMELLLKHPSALCVLVIIVLEQEMANHSVFLWKNSKDRGA